MAVSVFRRYTPPTCTLELRGERSPLSVWSDRPIIKSVQFQLSIDGPHRHQDQRVTVQGDRTQLEHLRDVVNHYVQSTLELSAAQFQTTILAAHARTNPDGSSALNGSSSPTPLPGQALAPPGRSPDMGWSTSSSRHSRRSRQAQGGNVSPHSSTALTLIPKGRLKHELHLGALAPAQARSSVVLSTTELFDLVHALDSYYAEVDSIPELNPGQRRRAVAPWMKAVAVTVVAVGAATTLANLNQFPASQTVFETASGDRPSEAPESAAIEEQFDQATGPELSVIPPATEALPETRESNAASDAPTDREAADDATDTLETEGSLQAQTEIDPSASATATNPSATNETDIPADGFDPAESRFPLPQVNRPGTVNPADETALDTPGAIASAPTTALPPELSSIPPIEPDADVILSDNVDLSADDVSGALARPAEQQAGREAERLESSAFETIARVDEKVGENASQVDSRGGADTQRLEAQSYFESRWQPPASLNQALQFRLLFNADGSLQRAIPLGESARAYRSAANLPEPGDGVVSPFEGNDTPPMRLVLGANGQVRVFLESLD